MHHAPRQDLRQPPFNWRLSLETLALVGTITLSCLSAAPLSAEAQVSGDWSIGESVDPLLGQGTVCTSQTSRIIENAGPQGPGGPVQAELSYRVGKGGLNAPYLLLKVNQTNGMAPQIRVRINSRTTHPFLLLQPASDPQSPNIYWAQPVGLDNLMDHVRANSSLRLEVEVTPGAPPVQWSVSLRGSSRALQNQARCVAGGDIYANAFFKLLRTTSPSAAEPPSGLGPDGLFRFVQTAFASSIQQNATQQRLDQIVKQIAPLVKEEQTRAEETQTAQRRLDRSLASLNQTKAQIQSLASARAGAEARVSQIQAEQVTATADLQTKRAVYEPLAQQLAPLERAAGSARQQLRSIRADLQQERDIAAQSDAEAQQLEAEARDLESRILPQLRREQSQIESDLRQADSDLSRFSPEFERQRILQNDFSYQNAVNRLNREESELRQAEFDDSNARSQLLSAQSRLNSCRAQANANCSNEESLVRQAEMQAQQASHRVQQARNQVSSTRAEIQRREFDAQQTVWTQQQRLQERRNDIARELSAVEGRIRSGESEVRDIRNTRIPQLRSQAQAARAEIRRLEALRSQAEADVARAESAVADFKTRTDFDRIEADFRAAQNRVDGLARELRSRQDEIIRIDRETMALRKTEATQSQDVTKRTATRDSALQRLNQSQAQLKPLRDQEVIAVSELSQLQTQLEDLRAIIQKASSKLIPS